MERRRLLGLFGSWAAALPIAVVAKSARVHGRELLILDCRIAGFAYYSGSECLASIAEGDALTLRREPNNAHDHRAVEIFWNDKKLGYVPRSHNRPLYKLMDTGERVVGEVKRIDTDNWEPLYFTVSVVV